MGMAHKAPPPPGYSRAYIIGVPVLDKVRVFVKDLASWPNSDLNNYVDQAISRAREESKNVETWWEDDFAWGIQKDIVVRIDQEIPQAKDVELYAIVRTIKEGEGAGREIVTTVLNEDERGKAIVDGRWQRKPPERSKFKRVEERKEFQVRPFEAMLKEAVVVAEGREAKEAEVEAEVIEKVATLLPTPSAPPPEPAPAPTQYAVSWEKGGTTGFLEVKDSLQDQIGCLLEMGVRRENIKVWKLARTKIRVQVDIE